MVTEAKVGVGACEPFPIKESKVIAGERALILWGGIDVLKLLQTKQVRDPNEEERIASTVNGACNCDGSRKFTSPTLISFISTDFNDTIRLKEWSRGRKKTLSIMGRLTFFGLVQGDKDEPWASSSDVSKSTWFLHFGYPQHDYYAPVSGINHLEIEAFKVSSTK